MTKQHILFVDDEPYFLEGIQRILRPFSNEWRIHYACDVQEALTRIEESAFGVIVSDVNMPGKSGFSLLEAMKGQEATQDIPVIILTGAGEDGLKRKALELGATDLLTKPVSPEDLIARIRNALRLKQYQDELKSSKMLLEEKVRERTGELEASRLDIILRLGKAAEYRDEVTGNHILRVGCYCKLLADELEMPEDFSSRILLTSPLHDIGKIGIPDRILLKKGRFTPQEGEIMSRHCVMGSDILSCQPRGIDVYLSMGGYRGDSSLGSANPLLNMAANIALCHHEKWDGSGYPRKLKGDQIPLEARIVSIADVYDALRSERPYKQAYDEEKALRIIDGMRGSHFDLMVHRAFRNISQKMNSIFDQFADECKSRGRAMEVLG